MGKVTAIAMASQRRKESANNQANAAPQAVLMAKTMTTARALVSRNRRLFIFPFGNVVRPPVSVIPVSKMVHSQE